MLNIARNIYSAWNTPNQKNPLPEAEIIPIGESPNEKKRLENVTKKYSVLQEYENIPLPGFTLFANNRKNFGSADPTWLVIDPRGFLVRISNDNLEEILHVTGITEGLIQQRCIWAREDSQTKMCLVPISSPAYVTAVDNTALIESKVDMKDVGIGDIVLLQNEMKGTYMGTVSLYGPINSYNVQTEFKPQGFLRRQVVEVTPGKYFYQADLKILKVLQKATIPSSREESVAKMNKDIADGVAFFSNTPHMSGRYFSSHGMIKHTSVFAVPKVTITFEEITNLEATALFYDAQAIVDSGMLLLMDGSKRCLVDFPYSYTNNSISIQKFTVSDLDPNQTLEECEKIHLVNGRQYWSGGNINTRAVATYSLDKFTKFYKIVKHVKKEIYI